MNNKKEFFGWTLWTDIMMGNKGWFSSMDLGSPEKCDPEGTFWSQVFNKLEFVMDETGIKEKLNGCYHISGEMARIISDDSLFEIYPKYKEARDKFNKKIPFELGVHAKFGEHVNPLGKKYHESLKEDLKYSKNLEATTLVVHPPYNRSWDREKYMDLLIDDVVSEDLVTIIDGTDIILAWENMIGGQFSDLHELLKFRAILKDRLSDMGYPELIKKHQFCLDTGHLLLWKYEHPKPQILQAEIDEYLPEFAKNLKVFHIHSNGGKRDNHIMPFSLEFFEHSSRKGIDKDLFMQNSKEVQKWIEICNKHKGLEGRHIHMETSTIPFSLNQIIEYSKENLYGLF